MQFKKIHEPLIVDGRAELLVRLHVNPVAVATHDVDLPRDVYGGYALVRSTCPRILSPLLQRLAYQGAPKDARPTQIATFIRCM